MGHKQEKEAARTEISEVAPNVLRMELPIRLPGLGHVNCYALLDRDGAALVDPGLPGPSTWRALQDRLKQAGLRVKDVHTVFVTHSHPDHFGGASRLAKEADARIVGHHHFSFGPMAAPPDDAEVSVDDAAEPGADGSAEPEPAKPASPTWGGETPWGRPRPRPPLRTRLRWRLMRLLSKTSFLPEISAPVEHGDVLELTDREWFVVHTPGHTHDHVCLHDPESGVFLAGDHVLPSITPHISGLSGRDPLSSFFYSLDRVAEISDVEIVLPAHGHPFTDLAARCEAIKKHHHERLAKVKAIGRDIGPAPVEAYTRRLFHPRSWGAMAESETYAHLEHLRLAGEADCHRDRDGLLIFATG